MRSLMVVFALVCVSLMMGSIASKDVVLDLNKLKPEQPGGYLELGEMEIMLGGDLGLAVELLVLGVFWGDQQGQPGVASSACIALTELVDDETMRRWLWDLALVLDPSREMEWLKMMRSKTQGREGIEVEAARSVYAIRYHQQPIGGELFGRSDVRERIFEAADVAGVGRSALLRVLEREIERGRGDSCRGRLYIGERGSNGKRVACPDHLRGLGFMANDEDLLMLLRVEMVLGGVEVDFWEAADSMSMDGVVELPTVGELVQKMGVNPSRAFYRDGAWVNGP